MVQESRPSTVFQAPCLEKPVKKVTDNESIICIHLEQEPLINVEIRRVVPEQTQ
jgi:hypothetical protein